MVAFFSEEYMPWVSEICKCLGANARGGFPGVNLPGWPLISALQSRVVSPEVDSLYVVTGSVKLLRFELICTVRRESSLAK